MSTESPEVHSAYLHALHDPSEKLVRLAAMKMPSRAEKGDAEALYAMLDHPFWGVRLEICKALIVMKKADNHVVSTLEAMRNTPEATQYSAQVDEMDKMEKSMNEAGESMPYWGKLDTILQRARDIAAKG